MKYINKPLILILVLIEAGLLMLSGCGGAAPTLAYNTDGMGSGFAMFDMQNEIPVAQTFAADLCVVSGNTMAVPQFNLDSVNGAGLFDLSGKNAIYAQNVNDRLYPASLTKIMTALVALKFGSLDTMLTASENVLITESGAQLCGLKPGDRLTLSQALHLTLINSANDAAIVVAEGVAGSVEAFAEMMNQEARAIGATNSHFVNPHGLSDEQHYTTVYDTYLILNEAIKNETFNQIIHMSEYNTTYTLAAGTEQALSVRTTNLFLRGEKEAPERVTILGGKTGTTNAAGNCLALVCQDTAGNPYISIVMRSESRDKLYDQMIEMLGQIN